MIELEGAPELEDPVLLAGFEGWNDAADSATAALDHLVTAWQAEPIAAIEPDDYYDFQVNRPVIRFDTPDIGNDPEAAGPHTGAAGETAAGGLGDTSDLSAKVPPRRIIWPTTRILIARPPHAPRDLVIVRGIEPNLRWRQFCAEILSIADALGADLAVLLGALLADNPHTRPIPISASTSDPELAQAYALEPSRYEGPSGIVGILADSFRRADLPTASLWAAVPHYVAQPPCPKATLALLRRLEDLLDISIPLGELPEEAQAWERGVDDLARDDTEVSEYVRSLEQARDAAELPEATGEAIAAEFERYLKRRPDPPPGRD